MVLQRWGHYVWIVGQTFPESSSTLEVRNVLALYIWETKRLSIIRRFYSGCPLSEVLLYFPLFVASIPLFYL